MIVKKMPILQGFPDFETVKFFTGKFFQKYNFSPVFYDIETTGLSRKSTFLYLIGAVGIEDETWYFHQWMAESDREEETILRIFSQFLQQCDLLISYNGERFDQPYLEARYEKYGLPSPFDHKMSLDLYLTLKPLKTLLKLPALKQPCLEEFLGIKDRIYNNGKECIQLYKDFLKKRDAITAEEILGHNLEDVLGLGRIFEMLSYLCIYDSEYEVTYAEADEEVIIFTLELPHALPAEFSNGSNSFYITGKATEVKLIVRTENGRLKQHYQNYKDYYYLPDEDTIIPKSLGSGIDKKHRKAATKDTCYTWFNCNEQFLQNPQLQKQYLEHALPYFLKALK